MQFDLDLFQSEHREWQDKNFPGWEPWEVLLGLGEEVGELFHAHLKQYQGIRMNENHDAHARDSVGDIVVFLVGYCNARGWLLSDVLNETWNHVKQREWRVRANPDP